MIQNQENIDYHREQEQLTKQISEYKRINASLKKKIQARDKRISYLFSCMDQMSKSTIQPVTQPSGIKKNKSEIDYALINKKEACLTQPKNKQKQNLTHGQHNIFKEKGVEFDSIGERFNLKLPALQRRNIFAENPEITESKPRIIKIAIEKLIPLKPEDVKKKFQNKFK